MSCIFLFIHTHSYSCANNFRGYLRVPYVGGDSKTHYNVCELAFYIIFFFPVYLPIVFSVFFFCPTTTTTYCVLSVVRKLKVFMYGVTRRWYKLRTPIVIAIVYTVFVQQRCLRSNNWFFDNNLCRCFLRTRECQVDTYLRTRAPLAHETAVIIIAGTVCTHGNTNVRGSKNTHRALWICNSNMMFAYPPPSVPRRTRSARILLCGLVARHESFRRRDLCYSLERFRFSALQPFSRFIPRSRSGLPRNILNIASGKSWISIRHMCKRLYAHIAQ